MGLGALLAAAGVGGVSDLIAAKYASDLSGHQQGRNESLQREFAQNGLRWRIEDGVRAGLSPLAAAGAAGGSSPSFVVGDTSFGPQAISNLGQNLGRAIAATSTKSERMAQALSLENQKLQNDVLRAQLSGVQRNQVGPPFPNIDYWGLGAGSGGGPRGSPVMPNFPYEDQSMSPDVTYSRTASGGLHPVMPAQLAESLESDEFIGALDWSMRNKVQPMLGELYNRFIGRPFGRELDMGKPSPARLPRGFNDWEFHFSDRSWHPIKVKSNYYLRKRRN